MTTSNLRHLVNLKVLFQSRFKVIGYVIFHPSNLEMQSTSAVELCALLLNKQKTELLRLNDFAGPDSDGRCIRIENRCRLSISVGTKQPTANSE